MKALKIIGGIIIGLLVILLISYFILPSEKHVERSIVINSKQDRIFNYLNSFQNFNEWSPWAAMDPNTEYSYEGSESGVGTKMSWTSEDPNVGIGAQEIIVSEPSNLITVRMEFEGFTGENTASYIFEPEGEGATRVTWTYDSKDVTGVTRYFLPMMDSMLGASYEDGLARLKEVIENMPEPVKLPAELPVEPDSTSVQ